MVINIVDLPENVLLSILQLCNVRDLTALSVVCSLFYRLTKDSFLWRHLCFRDFSVSPESCEKSSYEKIYKNVLHKYGCMLGLYQSQIGPYGGLLEIRFQNGYIEGAVWEPTSDVMEPLKESVAFSINGNEVPAKCLCIPHIHPHKCSLQMNKRKGIVTQFCSDNEGHIRTLCDMDGDVTGNLFNYISMKLVYLNEVISTGLIHKPLILPGPDDIPSALRRKDGSFPKQIITPGLFKGTYSVHGIEVLLFRYKDEYEIHGHKVTGDVNVHASKVSVKILLKYPAYPTKKNSIAAMKTTEPKSSETPLDQIPEHPFSIPSGCYYEATTPLPTRCTARYHGFGQIAYEGFRRPSFTPVQVIVFNNDLLGVVWIELTAFSLFSRVQRTFTKNILNTAESCL